MNRSHYCSLLTLGLVLLFAPWMVWAGDEGAGTKSPLILEEEYQPKSPAELRRMLTPLQYEVTQEEGTERAFDNKYWDNKRDGDYQCIVCQQKLFTSKTKYKSGTGWPSFYAPATKQNVAYRVDRKLFYTRTEVHCSRCKAHLGHVFDDGPKPTGLRYCMNSAALKFVDEDDADRQSDEERDK